jgi:hypothetical protein
MLAEASGKQSMFANGMPGFATDAEIAIRAVSSRAARTAGAWWLTSIFTTFRSSKTKTDLSTFRPSVRKPAPEKGLLRIPQLRSSFVIA